MPGRSLTGKQLERQQRRQQRETRMPVCSIEDCTSKAFSRSWCSRHYQAWYHHGDPLFARPSPPRPAAHLCSMCGKQVYRGHRNAKTDPICQSCRNTPEHAFWRHVDQTPCPNPYCACTCWIWMGTSNPSKRSGPVGRGSFHWHGTTVQAHVFSYELHTGTKVPAGREIAVDHACWNGLCVNPAHLRLVTAQENANNKYPLAVLGVFRYGHEFKAVVNHNSTVLDLGIFDSPVKAIRAVARKRLALARSKVL